MSRKTINFFILMLVVFIANGCAGKAGVRARSYVEVKERVDQKMEGGNFGYLHGTPVPEDRSKFKKTRKTYVLEITKDVEETEVEEVDDEVIEVKSYTANIPPRKKRGVAASQSIQIPSFDENGKRKTTSGEMTVVEYTIEKDDTLQKISKKFYDTYRNWPQIYETNKDVIKDPNRIKPGTVIKLEVEK